MPHRESLRRLAARLASREVSSVELTRHFLARIAKHGAALNSFITIDEEKSLEQAKAADAKIARGEAGPLTGIPLAHKDLFCAKGWLTTCGSKILENFVAPYDAHVIERFNAAGAVILGKTNMDEFAMGSSNENSHFGPVRNPWDTAAVPGGSSGGSAASVAAGLAPAATGTDTGGSIRQPASFTGVCGIRPTYGRVSRYGMVAFASSLDQGGALARSAEDLAIVLSTMAGHDARDSTSADRPVDDYVGALARGVKGLRIGMPREYFTGDLAPDVAKPIRAALDEFQRLGAKLVEVSLPNQALCVPAYYVIAPAEASSNLARFDGVRYGYRAPDYADLNDMYRKTRAQGFGAEVKRRIMIGTYVLSHGYYDAYYVKAQKIRRLIADDFAKAFGECDLIMGPAAPSVAFDLGARTKDPVQMYLDDLYTIPINLAGLPGMSIPCGFGDRGRPVGLQVVGNYFEEARMLAAGHAYQQATDWHTRRPAAFDKA
ncbi:MAG TPA: Asp-tRNA(Asn)/Glu-tRNA(Gln) amidotransferase subunit GatA [Usitatibacter sp.]|nr:Asp-tRNA(Asn)/Glu-tRNA(Gln) amidotransferase subunit GatA [Usitatibacter sp.]